MKTLLGQVVLAAFVGGALNFGAAAASDSAAPSPQATPATSTGQAPAETKRGVDPDPNEKSPRPEGRGAPAVSSQIAEVVRMTESGVGADPIQAHVQQSATVYPPSADEIIYLHNHGVSAEVIAAFISRGSELRVHAEQAARESLGRQAQLAPAAPAPAPAAVQAPGYVYAAQSNYAVYLYTYPNYVYVGYI